MAERSFPNPSSHPAIDISISCIGQLIERMKNTEKEAGNGLKEIAIVVLVLIVSVYFVVEGH